MSRFEYYDYMYNKEVYKIIGSYQKRYQYHWARAKSTVPVNLTSPLLILQSEKLRALYFLVL